MKDLPISPLQALFDGMGGAWQKQRAETQMTLGKLITALEALPENAKIEGLGDPASYRGYYEDLAFSRVGGVPPSSVRSVGAVLAEIRSQCMGRVFQGYKGGDFVMGENTPIWSAEWGDCGKRIVGLNTTTKPITLVTADEE